jgi:hypothetical protein
MNGIWGVFISAFVLFAAGSWFYNAYLLVTECDFASPYKCEAIHGIGVVVPPASMITAWLYTGN